MDGADPPPDPPLLGVAPDPSAWVITVQQKKALDPPPADPRAASAYARASVAFSRTVRVEVEKSGKNRREVTLFENKKQNTLFVCDGWVVYQMMNWPADQAIAAPVNDRLSPIRGATKSDFPDLDWIRPEVYVGRQSRGAVACFYYEDKVHSPLSGGDPRSPGGNGVRAWIDVQTRLPIAVEDGAVLKTYSYRQSDVNVELTGAFAKAYSDMLTVRKEKGLPMHVDDPAGH